MMTAAVEYLAPGATRKALNVGGLKNGDDVGAAVEATIGAEQSASKSEVSDPLVQPQTLLELVASSRWRAGYTAWSMLGVLHMFSPSPPTLSLVSLSLTKAGRSGATGFEMMIGSSCVKAIVPEGVSTTGSGGEKTMWEGLSLVADAVTGRG